MNINITNLIIILGLILGSQVVSLFVQYRVNKIYKGVGYWLIGSSLMAIGFMLMPLVNLESFNKIARIANPLIILGYICLYIGIKKFLNNKLNKWIPISIFIVFNLVYYFYMYIDNNVMARTIAISAAIAIISFMIAYHLFFKKDKLLSKTTNFTATIFFINGSFNVIRVFLSSFLPTPQSYVGKGSTLMATIVFSIIASNLWTLGLILMVNHRLNIQIQLEKDSLMESEEKYRSVLNASPDDITITDLEGRIIMISPAANEMFGYEADFNDFVGMRLLDFIVPEDVERAKANIIKMHQTVNRTMNEYCGIRKDGSIFDIEVNSEFVYNIHGIPDKMVFIIRDITKRKLIESEIQKLVQQLEIEKNIAQINSITDSLTGLFNRGYFDKTLRTEFARLNRSGSMLSLIMLDIDYFKKFNDNYGHLAGDKCIQMIAAVLQTSVSRSPDIVARYGGEEFIVILPETDENGAKILGERIRKGIEDLGIPHVSSIISKYVTVSVGILTIYPTELISPDKALNLVDEALYLAKEQGRNRCVIAETPTY